VLQDDGGDHPVIGKNLSSVAKGWIAGEGTRKHSHSAKLPLRDVGKHFPHQIQQTSVERSSPREVFWGKVGRMNFSSM